MTERTVTIPINIRLEINGKPVNKEVTIETTAQAIMNALMDEGARTAYSHPFWSQRG